MTNKKTIEQHRAEFEAWISEWFTYKRLIKKKPDGSYLLQTTEYSWQAWLAARGVKENQE